MPHLGPVCAKIALPFYKKQAHLVIEATDDQQDGLLSGSYGPLLIRLAWHSAGSYDKASNTGGSNGATMRSLPHPSLPSSRPCPATRLLATANHQQVVWAAECLITCRGLSFSVCSDMHDQQPCWSSS